jgi:hypothetical protein
MVRPEHRLRHRYRFALIAAVVLVAALSVNWWMGRRTMPDTLLGLPRMQTTRAAVGALDGYEPPLNFIGASYGTGSLPELVVAAGSSGATIQGPTPGDYLRQLQAQDPPAGLAIDPVFGITGIREVHQGEDRYACALVRDVASTYANRDGLMCYWTSGEHRLGEVAWFPSQPAGSALVTAGLKTTALIAHTID